MDIQKILDAFPDYILLLDDNHHILMANAAIKDALGVDPAEIIGGYCPKLVHGTEEPFPGCPLEEAVEKGVAVQRELYEPTLERWLLSAIYPTTMKTETGQTIYVHVVHDITDRKVAEEKLKDNYTKLAKMTDGVIQALAQTLECRDPYTAKHQMEVSRLAVAIARKMNIDEERVEGIRIAGLIHDIGKITIPSDILNKPGKISNPEFEIIKTHCEIGYNILKDIEFPWPIGTIVWQHHERIDGSGYPRGLVDAEISLEAKIIAVADVVEAMSSHRPYRQALGPNAALDELEDKKGILYDKNVADACLYLFNNNMFTFELTS